MKPEVKNPVSKPHRKAYNVVIHFFVLDERQGGQHPHLQLVRQEWALLRVDLMSSSQQMHVLDFISWVLVPRYIGMHWDAKKVQQQLPGSCQAWVGNTGGDRLKNKVVACRQMVGM
eukprot:200464-Pelagomonas_calceolata.AAC.4